MSNSDDNIFIRRQSKGRRFGLILTLVFHIILLAVLLVFSLKGLRRQEVTFLTDTESNLARQLEEEQEAMAQNIKNLAKEQLDEQLKPSNLKSIAVNTSKQATSEQSEKGNGENDKSLNEDENLKPTEVSEGIAFASQGDDGAIGKEKRGEYRGPSVLSWTLDGRRAMHLPIPAYKCQGEGIVYVQIIVGRNGYVKRATIIAGQSASSECLRNSAMEAAKLSRFSTSDTAPENQVGEIVYKFIAQ